MLFKGLLGGGDRQQDKDSDQGNQPDQKEDQDQARANTLRTAIIFVAAALVLLVGLWVVALFLSRPSTLGEEVRLDEFLSMVSAGSVQEVTILDADNRVIGESDRGEFWVSYGTREASVSRVLNALEANNVPHTVDEQWSKGLFGLFSMMLGPLLIVGVILLLVLIVVRMRYTQSSGGLGSFGKSGARQSTGEHKITFGDVAGQDEALEELGEVRDYLSNPERFLAMGAAVPKGILLTGPPGCGKTLLARAVAGEAGVPFFSMNGSEFVEMYVGVGAGRIRDLFKTAKAHAPCIVFIDELDAVGRGRSASAVGGQDERETTLNQLLVEMDGFESETGVVVLAATNRTDVLDSALMRPGRFDRRVGIDRPDVKGREGILRIHARGKPFAEGVDLQRIAKRTSGFSGADLANVVNEAALLAARRGREEIIEADLAEAVERVVAGPERKSRVLTARDRRLIAYHEAGHAIVSAALSSADVIQKVSVVGRGHAGGMTWFTREEEWLLATRSELEERLAFILAGRAAEYAAEGEPTSGAQNDLEHAIRLARRMVSEFGMGENVGVIAVDGSPRDAMGRSHSERVHSAVDTEVEGILSNAAERARATLVTHRQAWEALAEKLQEVETLEGPDLELMLAEVRSSRASQVANPDGAGES